MSSGSGGARRLGAHAVDVLAGFAFGCPVDVDDDFTVSHRGISAATPLTASEALARIVTARERERKRHEMRMALLDKAEEAVREVRIGPANASVKEG